MRIPGQLFMKGEDNMKRSVRFYVCMAGTAMTLAAAAPAAYAQETATEAATEAVEQMQTEEASEAKQVQTEEASETEKKMQTETKEQLEDGIYSARFDTDSSMFHVNEAKEGRGVLTVEDGQMTIHVSLASKGILNLFPGLAEDAQKEGAQLLDPTEDTVTYSDGYTETVYGFDIPVPVLEEEFDVALIGKKGKWYDHKVSVSDPVVLEEGAQQEGQSEGKEGDSALASAETLGISDGSYTAEVTLEGGSGKSTVESPAQLTVTDGEVVAVITWSSPNYDYMVVDGEKYMPVNTEGNSVFEIPVAGFDGELAVTADTVAMSTPHEIDYTLYFDSTTLEKADK